MTEFGLNIEQTIFWTAIYFFAVLGFATTLNLKLYRPMLKKRAPMLDLLTACALNAAFFVAIRLVGYKLGVLEGISLLGVAAASLLALALYLLLDKCIDPLLDGLLPRSRAAYEQKLFQLADAPRISFVRVCILAPICEELLMRGFILAGLESAYGALPALLISAAIFALLHFNMLQTLSALICGLALGVLYLKTRSVLCCILAHGVYNAISYYKTILPELKAEKDLWNQL